jgi:hypothetical protein
LALNGYFKTIMSLDMDLTGHWIFDCHLLSTLVRSTYRMDDLLKWWCLFTESFVIGCIALYWSMWCQFVMLITHLTLVLTLLSTLNQFGCQFGCWVLMSFDDFGFWSSRSANLAHRICFWSVFRNTGWFILYVFECRGGVW